MADMYTQFCFALPLDTPAADAWAARVIAGFAIYRETGDPGAFCQALGVSEDDGFDFDNIPEMEVELLSQRLVVSAEEYGDVEIAIAVCQSYCQATGIPAVSFEWADSASRAIIDTYGGGGVVVTATGAHEIIRSHRVREIADQLCQAARKD